MGIVTKGLTVAALTFGLSTTAFATEYVAADDSIESKLCVSAATSSKIGMHNEMKNFRTTSFVSSNYELVANKVSCNGMSIAEFALEAGNDVVAEKLLKFQHEGSVEIKDIAAIRRGTVHIGSH